MRLAEISDQALDYYDLSRAEARTEARAGQLWAASRTRIAVAPTAEAASWMLGGEAVERVECSTMSEAVLVRLGDRARGRRSLRSTTRAGLWDRMLGRLEIPLGESLWHEGQAGMAVGADSGWRQGSWVSDQVHSSWPATKPIPDWVRELVEKG